MRIRQAKPRKRQVVSGYSKLSNDYENKFEENISHFSCPNLTVTFLGKIRTQIDKKKQFEFMNL